MKKRKLRIAQFVTSQRRHPTPKGAIWAPIDLAVNIAKRMTERGHQVTFYAPPSPRLPYKVISGKLPGGVFDKKMIAQVKKEKRQMPYGINHICIFDQYLLGLMYADAAKGKYDVLHVHIERALPLAQFFKTPTLLTLHDPINPFGKRAYRLFKGPRQHLVSISYSQRKPAPDLNWAANIYNGIDMKLWKYRDKPRDHFLFSGRLVPQKGVEDAIKATKRIGAKLHIVGRHYNPRYLATVKRLCTKKVIYKGNYYRPKLPPVYGAAKALLFPIRWEEPFGLVMTEAMACGTPVIAYDRGSVREVIKDGVTGFIVKTPYQMARAMKKIDSIDRRACREWVQRRFSTERMVDDYEKLYYRAAAWKKK